MKWDFSNSAQFSAFTPENQAKMLQPYIIQIANFSRLCWWISDFSKPVGQEDLWAYSEPIRAFHNLCKLNFYLTKTPKILLRLYFHTLVTVQHTFFSRVLHFGVWALFSFFSEFFSPSIWMAVMIFAGVVFTLGWQLWHWSGKGKSYQIMVFQKSCFRK